MQLELLVLLEKLVLLDHQDREVCLVVRDFLVRQERQVLLDRPGTAAALDNSALQVSRVHVVELATLDQEAGSALPATRDTLATPALQEALEQPELKDHKASVEILDEQERGELLERLDPLVHWVEQAIQAGQALMASLDLQASQAALATLVSLVQ